MEIQLSNLTLKHLLQELSFLENGFVNNVQTLENGWIKMKIHTKVQGDKQLIITPNAFFMSNYSLPANQNPGGFSALLKKHLDNQRIISIKQHGVDRIVVFEFLDLYLIIELFAKGNLILCNKEMKIIRAARKEEWKDRKLEQNEEYKFPSSKGVNPLEEKVEDFEKKLKENTKTLFGACIDLLNASPQVLEFVFEELKIDKKKNAMESTKKEAKQILEGVVEIYSSKEKKVYLSEKVLYSVDLGKAKEQEFDSINSALNILLLSGDTKKEIIIVEPQKERKKDEKFLREMTAKQNQVAGLEIQSEELQKKGEEIYLHYNELIELFDALKKAKQKGLTEKETIEKINSIKPMIKELDFKKNVVKVDYKLK
jgi:predicted ribosome quality control (RQC) complex YloA/Tae2 family protein